MAATITLKTDFLKEISITEDLTDINDLIGSVTMLLFAAEYTLHDIKAGYEAELEIVKERIQSEIKKEQQTAENNE